MFPSGSHCPPPNRLPLILLYVFLMAQSVLSLPLFKYAIAQQASASALFSLVLQLRILPVPISLPDDLQLEG